MSELDNHKEKNSNEAANEATAANEAGGAHVIATTDASTRANVDNSANSPEASGGAASSQPLVVGDNFARAATTASRAEGSSVEVESGSEPSQKRPLTRAQKIGVGVVAVLSVAVIAVSAAFLFNPATSESISEQGSATQADEAVAAVAEQDAAAQAEAPAEGDAVGESEAPSSDESAPSSQQQVPPTPVPDSAQDGTNASGAPSGGSGSSGSATEQPAPAPAPAPATVTVSVSIDSSSVGSPVSGGTTATFAKGATAYDALMACGVSVNASNTAYGIYINAIGGLAEKEHGGMSGWHYAVNGSTPGMSCSSYTLSDGDTVRWFYSI